MESTDDEGYRLKYPVLLEGRIRCFISQLEGTGNEADLGNSI